MELQDAVMQTYLTSGGSTEEERRELKLFLKRVVRGVREASGPNHLDWVIPVLLVKYEQTGHAPFVVGQYSRHIDMVCELAVGPAAAHKLAPLLRQRAHYAVDCTRGCVRVTRIGRSIADGHSSLRSASELSKLRKQERERRAVERKAARERNALARKARQAIKKKTGAEPPKPKQPAPRLYTIEPSASSGKRRIAQRVCSGCGALLRRGNLSEYCGPCALAGRSV